MDDLKTHMRELILSWDWEKIVDGDPHNKSHEPLSECCRSVEEALRLSAGRKVTIGQETILIARGTNSSTRRVNANNAGFTISLVNDEVVLHNHTSEAVPEKIKKLHASLDKKLFQHIVFDGTVQDRFDRQYLRVKLTAIVGGKDGDVARMEVLGPLIVPLWLEFFTTESERRALLLTNIVHEARSYAELQSRLLAVRNALV